MTSTAGHHIATVRRFDALSGIATVVVPALYGDAPVEARPFLPTPAHVFNMAAPAPGDTVVAFYDGGDPMTTLRWYITGGAGGDGGAGEDEVWVGATVPPGAQQLWYDPTEPLIPAGPNMYVHNQSTPASTWVVVHDLSSYPNVTVEDSAGTTVEGEITYDNTIQLTLTFSAAFSGVAYCS